MSHIKLDEKQGEVSGLLTLTGHAIKVNSYPMSRASFIGGEAEAQRKNSTRKCQKFSILPSLGVLAPITEDSL